MAASFFSNYLKRWHPERDIENWNKRAGDWQSSFVHRVIKKIPQIVPAISVGNDRDDYWLSNGARIYIDFNSKLEMATAECLAGSLTGLANEKALELILHQAAQSAASSEHLKSVSFYKDNVGFNVNEYGFPVEVTYGSHQNYSYKTENREEIFELMRNFIPVAIPISGNGHILKKKNGKFAYAFSQRAQHIFRLKGIPTTGNRAIINLRDEPLMDKSSEQSRLHIISRDGTRCELQTWLLDTITHLILRLGEEGWKLPARFRLSGPVKTLRQLNTQIELDYKVATRSGFKDVISYNYIFLNAAKQLQSLSVSEKNALEEWERVLELLRAKAFDKLVGELDWVTKWYLIKNKLKNSNWKLDDVQIWKASREYHNISISPKISWYRLLEERGYIRHLISRADIRQALTIPPPTRAESRGNFVKKCFKDRNFLRKISLFNWDQAEDFNDTAYFFGKPDDPFSTCTVIGKKKYLNPRRSIGF